ncbi:hypothetical protein ACJRO7_031829 [Eucalyptus globulus]|uniref:PITH domain-containing protein n=1 Tax=Eucalyptus globulus TaxID=34317 RepID=A0ABD3JU22_EUCGL
MACMHDHSCEDHDCSSNWSLYKHIDLSKVSALNEAVPGSVKSVFKAWEHRLNFSEGYLESNDGDPELLVFIPFTSDVKIKSISIVGGADGSSPSKMRAFINREGIDFSDAQSMQAVQIFLHILISILGTQNFKVWATLHCIFLTTLGVTRARYITLALKAKLLS